MVQTPPISTIYSQRARIALTAAIFVLSVIFPFLSKGETKGSSRRYYIALSSTERISTQQRAAPAQLNVGEIVLTNGGFTDKDKQVIARTRYPSLIDGLNYLSAYGWRLDEAYSSGIQGQTSVTWILYKDVVKDIELSEGLGADNN